VLLKSRLISLGWAKIFGTRQAKIKMSKNVDLRNRFFKNTHQTYQLFSNMLLRIFK
jgi:hypothetical protein